MQALVYTDTQKVALQELAEPELAAGFSRVDLHRSGICGSDMHAYFGHDERRKPPLVLGHEAAGVVREGGLKGERVVINPLMTCGCCEACRSEREHLCPQRELIGMRIPGAFAQSVMVAEQNLVPIADDLAFADAALAEPLACAVHAARLATQHYHADASQAQVLILGGGAIGLLCAKVMQWRGMTSISVVEANPLRLKMLHQALNGIEVLSPQQSYASPHIIVDAVGSSQTRQLSSQAIAPGGVIVHIGLQDSLGGLDTRRITLQEVAYVGAYCYTRSDFAKAVELLQYNAINGHGWTEQRPLEQGAQAFADLANGRALAKVILQIPQRD